MNLMVTFLKYVMAGLGLFMLYTTVVTSLESNLVAEWSTLAAIPWMRATLIDFYINIAVIFLWVVYKERTLGARLIWLVLLLTTGSMAATAYVVIQLHRLKPGESWELALMRRPADLGAH
jgi:hypothetical protein